MNDQALAAETRAQLNQVSSRLLQFHKMLLAVERASYEQINGAVSDSYAMFGLVLNDPHFAWLRVLSGWIVELDEFLAAREPGSEQEGQAMLKQTGSLLRFEVTGDDFANRLQAAMQASPEVILERREMLRLLEAGVNQS